MYRPRRDDGVERRAQDSLAQVAADLAEFRLRYFDIVLRGFEGRHRLVERRLADPFFREQRLYALQFQRFFLKAGACAAQIGFRRLHV